MDKCFWKKVLAVVFGVALVSFLASAISTINYKLTSNDYVDVDLKALGTDELINKNVIVLAVLLLCIVGIIVAQLIKNKTIKVSVSGVVLAISIVTAIVGIVLLWNYREDMYIETDAWGKSDRFVVTKYAVWQEYISNMMTLSFYAVIAIASLFTNTLITTKKDANN